MGLEYEDVYGVGGGPARHYANLDVEVDTEVRRRLAERKVEEKILLIDEFGPDRYPDGTVVRFSKQFKQDGIRYSYAAIKAVGLWHTTGPRSPKGYTWEDFTMWLVSGDAPTTSLEVLTGNERP